MRFSPTSDHREFFSKNGFVEFENFLTLEQITLLNKEIDQTLANRLKVSLPQLQKTPVNLLFQEGFDLWRDSEALKKVIFKSNFAEIASYLFNIPLLRMGFDQYLPSTTIETLPLSDGVSLQDISSAKPLAGGLLLNLSEDENPLELPCEQTGCPVPLKRGNVVFLSAEKPIPWHLISTLKNQRFFAVVYATKRAIYHLDNKDPHTHAWKRRGYVFGDRLNDHLHPILFRG